MRRPGPPNEGWVTDSGTLVRPCAADEPRQPRTPAPTPRSGPRTPSAIPGPAPTVPVSRAPAPCRCPLPLPLPLPLLRPSRSRSCRRRRTTQRSIDLAPQQPGRADGVGGLGQVADNHKMADTGHGQARNGLRRHPARHEDGNSGACAGQTDVADPRPLAAGLRRRRLHRPGRDVGDVLTRRSLQVLRRMGGQPDDGGRAQDPSCRAGVASS